MSQSQVLPKTTLIRSTNELLQLINRVNHLQRENEKKGKRNQILEEKTHALLEVKRQTMDNKELILQKQRERTESLEQFKQRSLEVRTRHQQKRNASEEQIKTKLQALVKDEKNKLKLQMEQLQKEDQIKREQIYFERMQQREQSKQQIQEFWRSQLESLHLKKSLGDIAVKQQCELHEREKEKLDKIETVLLSKLNYSNDQTKVLNKQLQDLYKLNHYNFLQIYPNRNKEQSTIKKQYYQDSVQSRYLDNKKYNIYESLVLPKLYEPQKKFSEQTLSISREQLIKAYKNTSPLPLQPMKKISYTDRYNRLDEKDRMIGETEHDHQFNNAERKQFAFSKKVNQSQNETNRSNHSFVNQEQDENAQSQLNESSDEKKLLTQNQINNNEEQNDNQEDVLN